MKHRIIVLIIIFSSCSSPNECPELNYNSINKLTTLSDGVPFTGRCTVYKDGVKSSIQQYLNGIDYGNWIFIFQMEKLKQKESSEMVIELESGDIITILVRLSRYQAILNLVKEKGNGLNMMRTER